MTNRGVSRLVFRTLDRLTDRYPTAVPPVLQRILLVLLGNRYVSSSYLRWFRLLLRRVKVFDRILLIADVNIGDAINLQQSVVAFRQFFPHAVIDYVCNETGGELMRGMPEANHVFRVFKSYYGFPVNDDLNVLKDIVKKGDYSLIACYSPFVTRKDAGARKGFVPLYLPLASCIMRLWKQNKGRRHISLDVFTVTCSLLEPFRQQKSRLLGFPVVHEEVPQFRGNAIYLSPAAIHHAHRFLLDHGLSPSRRMLFLNPDATTRYSQIPFGHQARALHAALESDDIDAVLLASGRSDLGIEQALVADVPPELRSKVIVVPHVPVGVFAALIDACDMFVSADTGPAHIAASRKVALSEYGPVRNRTAVVTVFGAGDSKMYGYDSCRIDHIPANQTAPSRIFEGRAVCRNITCINKWGKSCREIRCFHGLGELELPVYITSYFKTLRQTSEVVFGNVG